MLEESIRIGPVHGDLALPAQARGLVLFVHGSGSSRFSPRNRAVAAALHPLRLGTLLFDLLTEDESYDRRKVFDIALLAARVGQALDGVAGRADLAHLPLGLFGASTGSAAALRAAAERPERIGAVVSRGGRPDLAADWLARVRAPTLLIVGGDDMPVIGMNEEAMARMRCEVELEIVPGATHLFQEPGALERVAKLARRWFLAHLGR